MRFSVTGLVAAVGLSTYVSQTARDHLRLLLFGLIYVITTHAYFQLAINDLLQTQAIAVVVILAVTPWRYVWQRYVTAPGDPWR